MKRINLYIASMAFVAAAFIGCDDTENFDNKVYIDSSNKTDNVIVKSTTESDERSFQVAMAKPEGQDMIITFKADPSLVDTYNAAYYDSAVKLPEGHYSLSVPELTIPAGSVLSSEVTVQFTRLNELDLDLTYVLPVTINNASLGILQSARTMYYIFKGAALINVVADIADNHVYVKWKDGSVVNGMRQMTAEALIRVRQFGKLISSVMGIEGQFLIRIGDSGIPDNQLQVATSSGNYTSADLGIPTNQWVHVAMTYDADARRMRVYINGVNKMDVETQNIGAVNWGVPYTDEADGSRSFRIGYSWDSSRYLDGEISEVRIWNRVLTAAEINAKDHFYEVDPASEGLQAYWRFNDGNGTTIKDHTINENDGTAFSTMKWTSVELPAK